MPLGRLAHQPKLARELTGGGGKVEELADVLHRRELGTPGGEEHEQAFDVEPEPQQVGVHLQGAFPGVDKAVTGVTEMAELRCYVLVI